MTASMRAADLGIVVGEAGGQSGYLLRGLLYGGSTGVTVAFVRPSPRRISFSAGDVRASAGCKITSMTPRPAPVSVTVPSSRSLIASSTA